MIKKHLIALLLFLTVIASTSCQTQNNKPQPTPDAAVSNPKKFAVSTGGIYNTGVEYRGINRAGAEYGDDWSGWNGQTFFTIPDATTWNNELTYLAAKGFNYVRIPFSWERAQHSLNGPLNTSYWNSYAAMVNQAVNAGFRVVVDLHGYGRYATNAFTSDQGVTQNASYSQHQLGDGTLTFAHLADVWTKVAATFAAYPAQSIDYNLINESHDLVMTSTTFFAGVQSVMNAIRTVDNTHMIIVPNTRASDIDHWSSYSPGDIVLGAGKGGPLDSVAALTITDSANNYAFDMHIYYESTSGEWTTYLANVTNWAINNNKKLVGTEIGISNTNPNGSALVKTFLTTLNNNGNAWFGWNEWNLPPQNITASNNYLADGLAMSWYTPFLTPGIVTSNPPPPPSCTYTYSNWGVCQSTGIQVRTVTGSSPNPCTPVFTPPSVLTQPCTYIPPVTPACVYTYSPWGACQPSNIQSRTVIGTTPNPCTPGSQLLSQTCTYIPPIVTDRDSDGIIDSNDKCPTVKGIKTTDGTSNGCPGLTVTAEKTSDWGSGYCKQYYFKNVNPVPMSWKGITIYLNDGTLRGSDSVWGGTFSNPLASGTIIVTPAGNATINSGQNVQTIGFCADKGKSLYVGTSGGLTY